ncbi:MAG: hypothetical protein GX234_06270 [Clostridiales bacterium]|nr:hypothetical protein [Clostridiales bacterium]
MLPEHFFEKIQKKIKPEWRFAFLSTFGLGFLIHLYRLVNPLLTWDSLYNFHDPQNTIHLGRCFLTLTCGISSYYDLPTVNGLLSLLYIALTAVCLSEIFEIRSRLSLFLMSGILASFPTAASTLLYMYTADGYFLAMLLAALAVLVTLKYRHGLFAGMVLLCISYGSYQAYISYAVMLILVWSILQLLYEKTALKDFFQKIGRFVLMGGCGTALYLISFKLLSALEHIQASDYQGVSTMKLPGISDLLHAVPSALTEFIYFFFGPLSRINLFKILNVLLFVLLFLLFILGLAADRLWKDRLRLLLLVICYVLLPFGCCIIYFVTPDVKYHMLMMMGFSLIYLLPILQSDRICQTSLHPAMVWTVTLVALVTVYNFALIDNITYLHAKKSYEQTYALAVEMADRIEQTDGFENVSKLCVLGHFDDADSISINFPPNMTGIKEGYIATEQNHFAAFLNTYLGMELSGCTEEEAVTIGNSPESQSMALWPAASSVRIENDTVIIKIGGDS